MTVVQNYGEMVLNAFAIDAENVNVLRRYLVLSDRKRSGIFLLHFVFTFIQHFFVVAMRSDVSAHTAMLTLSLGDVIKDPAAALASILEFIWRDDWEWEGHGAHHPKQGPPPQRGWKREAEGLVEEGRAGGGSLRKMLEETSLVLREATSHAGGSAFRKTIQGAFASEMKRSEGMTAWPCPSFWEGVNAEGGDLYGDDDLRVLQQLAGEMVPNCSDDDPFARCTVNKDRCEVKRNAKCK